jgi:hypothetical protein
MTDSHIQVINEKTEDNLTGIVIDGVPYLYWLRVYKTLGLTPNHARKVIERLEPQKHYIYFLRGEFKDKYPTVYKSSTVDPHAASVIFLTAEGYNRAIIEIGISYIQDPVVAAAVNAKKNEIASIYTRYQQGEVLSIATDKVKEELPGYIKASDIIDENLAIANSFIKYACPHLKIDPGLVTSACLSHAEQVIQKRGDEIDLTHLKGMIPRLLTGEPATLTATTIGEYFSISRTKINEILEYLGYHAHSYRSGSSGNHKEWTPTPKGELHGEWKPVTKGHHTGSIYSSYKWYWKESIIRELREHLFGDKVHTGQATLPEAASV